MPAESGDASAVSQCQAVLEKESTGRSGCNQNSPLVTKIANLGSISSRAVVFPQPVGLGGHAEIVSILTLRFSDD